MAAQPIELTPELRTIYPHLRAFLDGMNCTATCDLTQQPCQRLAHGMSMNQNLITEIGIKNNSSTIGPGCFPDQFVCQR